MIMNVKLLKKTQTGSIILGMKSEEDKKHLGYYKH